MSDVAREFVEVGAPTGFSPPSVDVLARRVLDVVIALAVLVLLAPLFIVVAAFVRAQDGGPALFAHERIGQGGRTFKCLKFRSMLTEADARLAAYLATNPAARAEWERDHKLRQDPRITRLGHFLRRSSIDELPQLFNVLRGEMSLVGPRPIVHAEVHRYGWRFRHYTAVKPGITGLWQVSGRNNTTYRRRVALDSAYGKTASLALYVGILLRTVPAVVLSRGSF
jgi:lipopolysaccharide/colanic/teichoic acid biosynthesis glycosyltransferase